LKCTGRAANWWRQRNARAAGGGGGDASLFELDDQVIFAGRAIPEYCGRVAATGEVAADFRHAHSRGDAGQAKTTIDMMNMVRYFLPHLLALSTSSPFWMGRNTGLKSFRTTVFRRFPRTGIPEQF